MVNAEGTEMLGRNHSGPNSGREPAAWVRTEILECELWNAIAEEFSKPDDELLDCDDEPDPPTPEDDLDDEAEMRGSLLRQLADLRPELAELFSEPSCPDE